MHCHATLIFSSRVSAGRRSFSISSPASFLVVGIRCCVVPHLENPLVIEVNTAANLSPGLFPHSRSESNVGHKEFPVAGSIIRSRNTRRCRVLPHFPA